MFSQHLIDHTPVLLLFVATMILLLVGSEVGYRLGRWRQKRNVEGEKVPANTMMGSALGLLAFILAFTFGMSSTRFDARKQLAQDEASAILRTYQRAQLLPEAQKVECSRLLREYALLRIEAANIQNLSELEKAILHSEGIQDELWRQTAILAQNPNAMLAGYMQSLTELTDLQIKRLRAVSWNRIPITIILALYAIAFLGLATMGYSGGLTNCRTTVPAAVLVLAFSAVIVLIIDLERPQQELFSVPQEPMIETARRIDAFER